MGNCVPKIDKFSVGHASSRHQNISVNPISESLDEGWGHSFCYIRPDSSKTCSDEFSMPFRVISGAYISANPYTPPTTTLIDPFSTCTNSNSLDSASSFESSRSFSSVALQPVARNSGPFEGGLLSGPIQRSSVLCQGKDQAGDQYSSKCKNKFNESFKFIESVKKAMLKCNLNLCRSKKAICWYNVNSIETVVDSSSWNSLSTQSSLFDETHGGDEFIGNRNVEWAQGKAGEDRVHLVVSEEHGWVFVGIYDGFSGPDATDYLLTNLYSNVFNELTGLSWNDKPESVNGAWSGAKHSDVLKALSEALRKTEESFLEMTDTMLDDNPELALMGSCVLVMMMKGDDVYLMNVGDSRAVLAQKLHLERIVEEASDGEDFTADAFRKASSLTASQLTFDHCTSVQEEVRRIKSEHLDDSSAIRKNRVKGSLMVTRAFGAGFLKQPKWNNALLAMFRINYVGNSPYLNCSPWLHHHRLGLKDKFLILSSDGLHQYFTNEEAVAEVDLFNFVCPEGDPAQHLVEEVLFRAAKKAGLKFHELLDIPQGERRKYHDDVSIVIISFEGRIWRSSL